MTFSQGLILLMGTIVPDCARGFDDPKNVSLRLKPFSVSKDVVSPFVIFAQKVCDSLSTRLYR